MANRSGRSVPFNPFHVDGLLPEGLLAVPRLDGSDALAVSESFASLARKTGAIADRQAEEAGRVAGLRAAQGATSQPVAAPPAAGGSPPATSAAAGSKAAAPGSMGAAIARAAAEIGASPKDLATVIAYETAGTFSPKKWGGTGGNYMGLIQFGPEERAKYGVHEGQSFDEQMGSVVAYLKDRGFKPGMGLEDLYSTINAGTPGRYRASDGPGKNVLTHVAEMRKKGGAAQKADAVLAGVEVGSTAMPASIPVPGFNPVGGAPRVAGGTIYGDAFNAAAVHAQAWRLETAVNNDVAGAYEALKDDPAKLDARLEEIKKGYLAAGGYDDPDNQELLNRTFDAKAGAYRLQARTLAADRQQAAARTSAAELVASQRADIERQAFLLPQGIEGDRALGALTQRSLNQVDVMVGNGLMTPEAAAREKKVIASSAVGARLQGVFDALPDAAAKERFATGLRKEWASGKGPLKGLDFQTVDSLADQFASAARREATAKTAEGAIARTEMENVVQDDLASIQATGKEVTANGKPLDTGRVAAALGPARAADWAQARKDAHQLYAATGDFDVLPEDQIEQRLAQLQPEPGAEGYATSAAIHAKAEKKAAAVVKLRREDPARAASQAFQPVRDAEANFNPHDPATAEAMIKARLDGQASLGIPELGREPLTKQEALALSREVLAAPKGGDQLKAIEALGATVGQRYGTFGDEVMTQLLSVRGIDKELSAYGATLIRKLGIGEPPKPSDGRKADKAGETARADAAMSGRSSPSIQQQLNLTPEQQATSTQRALSPPPLPNPALLRTPTAAAIARLKADPGLAPKFDEVFGPGSSRIYLEVK